MTTTSATGLPDPVRAPGDIATAPARPAAHPWRPLLLALAVAVAVLAGWELFARRFEGLAVGSRVRGPVVQDASSNDDLRRTLDELPAARGPRIVLFGSSQVHSVKDEPPFSPDALPFRMTALQDAAPGYQVADLSGPAQQAFESMAVLLSNRQRLAPSVVVLGVGLFSLQSTDIRPALEPAIDAQRVRASLDAIPAADLDAAARQAILANVTPGTGATKTADSTIQQRIDARLDHALRAHSAIAANRRAMYNTLINEPLRQDLIGFLQRRAGPVRTARTYQFNERYPIVLDGVRAMAAALAHDGIPFVVVLMPYEHTRTPVPYTPETQARVAADLRAAGSRYGFPVLDLSDALGVQDFGLYADGSPDGLHFKAHGHAVVGARIAEFLAPILRARAAPGVR